MKFIHSVNGSVALHVPGDDVIPENGFIAQEFIEFLASTYRFLAQAPSTGNRHSAAGTATTCVPRWRSNHWRSKTTNYAAG